MKVLKSSFLNCETEVTVIFLSDEKENEFRQKLKNKSRQNTNQITIRKVELIGDSQVRGVGKMLSDLLPSSATFVSSTSGASTIQICKNLILETSHLTPNDNLYIMSGTNDIKDEDVNPKSVQEKVCSLKQNICNCASFLPHSGLIKKT